MTDEELGQLTYWLQTIAEMRCKPAPSDRVLALFARLLEPYPYAVVEQAIFNHMASSAAMFGTPLQPAHIIDQIQRIAPAKSPTAVAHSGCSPPMPKAQAISQYLRPLREHLARPRAPDPRHRPRQSPNPLPEQEPAHAEIAETTKQSGDARHQNPATDPRQDQRQAAAPPAGHR